MRQRRTNEGPDSLSYGAVVLARVGAAVGIGAAGYAWIAQGQPQVALIVASTITWLATIPVLRRARQGDSAV